MGEASTVPPRAHQGGTVREGTAHSQHSQPIKINLVEVGLGGRLWTGERSSKFKPRGLIAGYERVSSGRCKRRMIANAHRHRV